MEIVGFILAIALIIYVNMTARKKSRNTFWWTVFAIVSPILAAIIIACMSTKKRYDK